MRLHRGLHDVLIQNLILILTMSWISIIENIGICILLSRFILGFQPTLFLAGIELSLCVFLATMERSTHLEGMLTGMLMPSMCLIICQSLVAF